jgi:hypothetical protein
MRTRVAHHDMLRGMEINQTVLERAFKLNRSTHAQMPAFSFGASNPMAIQVRGSIAVNSKGSLRV